MIKISKEAKPNYLAKIVQLKNLKKHPKADRLQIVDIDFQSVITGLDAEEGDVYVYFPVESKINEDFLAFTNSFRVKEKNVDSEKEGFFDDNGRVRAMRLRGIPSQGYIVPIAELEAFVGVSGLVQYVGEEFDTINGVKLLEKYVVKKKEQSVVKQGKKPKTSRLVDGQVNLHVDTEQLVRNVHKLNLNDVISISYKTHGTSWWTSNVQVKRNLKWYEKLAQKLGVQVEETEYDHVYGSRKVVKNKHLEDPKAKDHFYGYDLWEDIKNEVAEYIPKNYTLYGECIGYTRDGGYIQEPFDYSCAVGDFKLEVYRITVTNPDGLVTELSTPEIQEFCYKVGLTPSHLFYHGTVRGWMELKNYNLKAFEKEEDGSDWREVFIEELRKEYNEKNCFMSKNEVPEEGVVIRKEGLFSYDAFKLKSFKFLEFETGQLDKGKSDIESEN